MKKRMKSKSTKIEGSSASAAANQDIIGLLTALVQKLTSFETKIDTVLSRIPSQPYVVSRPQPTAVPSTERSREPRPMHKAICADCGKDCEVPFKPSGGRPVYCKECFTTRKNNRTPKPQEVVKPKEEPPVHAHPSKKKKAAKPTRLVEKKKPLVKKKRKNSRKK